MSLKHALLGFLTVRPATGYELKGWFEGSVQHFWHADLSQIYRTLEEIKAEGLATLRVEPQQSKPPKHIYSLSDKGQQELTQWLREPLEDMPVIRNHFLLKIFFGALLPKDEVIEHLRRYRQCVQERLAVYHGIERRSPEHFKYEGLEAHRPYAMATLRMGIKILEASAEWCAETIAQLQTLPQPRSKPKRKRITGARSGERTRTRSHV